MSLNYNFHIEDIFPQQIYNDAKFADLLNTAGLAFQSKGNKMSLYEDIQTVAALRAAPDSVKQTALGSGFGLSPLCASVEGALEGKLNFLIPQLTDIRNKLDQKLYTRENAKLAVFHLHMHSTAITRSAGEVTDPQGNDMWWLQIDWSQIPVTEPYDVSQAIDAMMADLQARAASSRPKSRGLFGLFKKNS
ncbi:hypothetical protein [Pseudaestuariivita rosea]|uniref:hypothetical protein n=1 Tax=Pseudaestuariivita rosea TaxID=2763263 RepID=UPI001ABA8BF1|nr:hypothetical protein [Pseudaestuariivita rosea]